MTSTDRAVRRVLRSRVPRSLTRPASDLLDSRISRVAKRQLAGQQGDMTSLRAEIDALTAQVAELTTTVQRVSRFAPALELLLGHRLAYMDRALDDATFNRLVAQVRKVTDAPKADHHVAVGFTTLVELESRGLGRIAGSTPNVVGKLTTTPLLDLPGEGPIEVLEIGTLFGLFSAGLHRQLSRRGRAPRMTIVDPLDGVQLQPERNANTDQTTVPVIEAVVAHNLRLSGVPEGESRIIRGFSNDEDVRAKAADRRYGVVIVDGDHSEAGVAADLKWVEDLVEPGGIVVLDDYGDRKWPGVEAAVKSHLEGETRFSLIGAVSSSAFLRAK